MSAIVLMSSTDGEFVSGSYYRVISRYADYLVVNNLASIVDKIPEPSTTIEGE